MPVNEWSTKPRPVRLSAAATATRAPSRGRGWTVEVGCWRGEGSTEKAAADALANGLEVFIAAYRPPVFITFRGYIGVVWVQPSNGSDPLDWREQIAHPDGHSSQGGFSAAGWDEAEAHARCAIARTSTDWHDDDSVHQAAAFLTARGWTSRGDDDAKELYRYAAWQRAAKAAMDVGRDDWHEWATANAKDYVVPPPQTVNVTSGQVEGQGS